MILRWKNDDDAIATIARMGLAPEFRTVLITSIDVKTSRHNHARRQAIIDSNVEDYADAMRRGDVFPKIVLARVDGSRQWLVAGGNHRIAAAISLKVVEVDAICVECDAALFSILCPALNLYVGQREDRAVRIQQAANMVSRLGVSCKQAAEDYGVPVSSVSHAVNESRVVVAAARLGIKADDLGASLLRAIAPLDNDATLLPLSIALARTKLNSEEVRATIAAVRKLPTEAAKVAFLESKIREAKKITVSGRVARQQTRATILRALTTLETILMENVTLCKLQITLEESRSLSERLMELASYAGSAK